jgi:nickel/cobalt exporter
MTNFAMYLQDGNAWLFIPSAIFLGALHGLEPGHSKTMMAAFIVAIRGTVAQAILLGLAATLSHTGVVWAVAMLGMYFGQGLNAEATEPYLQTASGVLIFGIAAWMLIRVWRERVKNVSAEHKHDESKRIDTGHGLIRLDIFEDGVPPRFRLHIEQGASWSPDQIRLETLRLDGTKQSFKFAQQGDFLESIEEIPEPHEFSACLSLGHGHHTHDYELKYSEHDHVHSGLDVSIPGEAQDAHQLAHANEIRNRFATKNVTTAQIAMFGFTGGLIPCPASVTVLLLCLQLKKIALGATLVLCFSIGLAVTMVASGTLAALSVRHVSRRWSGFGKFANKAPYFSGALILIVGIYILIEGLHGLGVFSAR